MNFKIVTLLYKSNQSYPHYLLILTKFTWNTPFIYGLIMGYVWLYTAAHCPEACLFSKY